MIDLVLKVLKELFGSWQLGLIVSCFLILFPLVFMLASIKPKVRNSGPSAKFPSAKKPTVRTKPSKTDSGEKTARDIIDEIDEE